MSGIKMLYNRRGFALEATLFVLLLLAVLCVFAVSGVTTTTRTANYDYRNTRTNYAAEAASDDIMQQLSGMVDDGFISQVELDSLTRPTVPGFSIPTMTVTPNGGATQETINDPPFAGLYALVRNYDINTRATDSSGNASRAVVTVKAAAIPIFQFGVFYEKDLEITNGARLDMQGWVHTNGNIYGRSGGGLYLHNIVTTPNKFRFRRKDGANPASTDQVYIDDAGGTARQVNNDSDGIPGFSAFRTWSDTRFSGRLKTNAYGVDSLRLPLPLSVPPEELIAGPRQWRPGHARRARQQVRLEGGLLHQHRLFAHQQHPVQRGGRDRYPVCPHRRPHDPDGGAVRTDLPGRQQQVVGEPGTDLRRRDHHRLRPALQLDGALDAPTSRRSCTSPCATSRACPRPIRPARAARPRPARSGHTRSSGS